MSELQPTHTPAARRPVAGWYDDPRSPAALRYWDGAGWTEHRAPKPAPVPATTVVMTPPVRFRKTSHGFHLIMTILTLGLWLPVWIVMAMYNAARSD